MTLIQTYINNERKHDIKKPCMNKDGEKLNE